MIRWLAFNYETKYELENLNLLPIILFGPVSTYGHQPLMSYEVVLAMCASFKGADKWASSVASGLEKKGSIALFSFFVSYQELMHTNDANSKIDRHY